MNEACNVLSIGVNKEGRYEHALIGNIDHSGTGFGGLDSWPLISALALIVFLYVDVTTQMPNILV